ncbi:MAG: sn-glycerol-3-phosphate ABC transporter ATP-binding protein UgpC [Pseudooceanicola sp.]|nr:sn-glycerol-3-phosphate ABC transporter ATP-binding protein UgpC [Pseudooceanicola sp.]
MADIRISGLAKAFNGTQVLDQLDLEIRSREFLVILGPSGCGKSTLLRLIAGLEDTDRGQIMISGDRVDHLRPGDRGCAMVFQNYALYPHMSVAANMGYGLKVAGTPRSERERRVAEAAKMLELDALLDRKPSQLSGGQRQRVAMGRAMTRDPKVFLFDEPLSNLDAKLRSAMRAEIRRLHKKLGTTSVFVTHDQLEAMSMADRMVVMNRGRIEQIGTPQELFRRPETAFVAGFIGTPPMNMMTGRVLEDGRVATDSGWGPAPDLRCALPQGTALSIGVRPGDLRLTGGDTRFSLELCEDLGTELQIHAQDGLGGPPVILTYPVDRPPPTGSFGLTAAPEQMHLFDLAGGARLDERLLDLPAYCGPDTPQTRLGEPA